MNLTVESIFGTEHDVPGHHRLDQCLHDYIEAAGITDDVDGHLFRTARRKAGQLTTNPLFQQDAHRIIRRRAQAASIETRICNHTFRATGSSFTLVKCWVDETSGDAVAFNTGAPSYQVEDEEGRLIY